MNQQDFDNLFVLELANNHLGQLERGLRIIDEYSKIVRFNNVKAAIKLQFRDVEHFIHKRYQQNEDIRYIKKTRSTKLDIKAYGEMIAAIVDGGCIPMATPFDEASVDLCEKFNLPMIKIASSSINDWSLIEEIAQTRRPVIVSTGGASISKDLDDIVMFFDKRTISLAINHCVSIYPSLDSEIELNQIDFLKNRYAGHTIGFSTYEYQDWSSSIMMAYAKGARLFERHIDIEYDNVTISPYCSRPDQIDLWFKSYKKAVEMCGSSGTQKRISPEKETRYLDALVRGIYAKRDLPAGYRLSHQTMEGDIYAAIPLQQGQISCRELMSGEVLLRDIKCDSPVLIDDIDSDYAKNSDLKKMIYKRGV